MKYQSFDLTYCLNMHPTRTLDEVTTALRDYLPMVKTGLNLENPLGVGLRLGAPAARELMANPTKLADFKDLLSKSGLYVFTINGFPYGEFNQGAIKEQVYFPDWGAPERLAYTEDLIDLLVELLPEHCAFGSISTVPVTYQKELPAEALALIARCAEKLQTTKRPIYLAFEPEPDCYLENTAECLTFFDLLRNKLKPELMSYLGICLDTCHFAVNFESPLNAWETFQRQQIPVPKIQVSAALKSEQPDLLRAYAEPVYLHQTRVKNSDGEVMAFSDLNVALEATPVGEWRVHYHVPIYTRQFQNGLQSTALDIEPEFWRALKSNALIPHLEVETYTFEVLPQKQYNMATSIVAELQTLIQWLDDSPTV